MTKRLIALLISICLVLSGCSFGEMKDANSSQSTESVSEVIENEAEQLEQLIPTFSSLSDPELCTYIENTIYTSVIEQLDSEDYLVEDVEATYVSKEYLEELSYNSQSNIYFGYSLADIEAVFDNQKYVFTCNENGETVVEEYEIYDDTFDQIVKNVAIGTGVILVCVTVSVATGGTAPAVSAIFAMSAKTATKMALETAWISAIITAVVTGYQTNNIQETLKQTALMASEGFKFGAIFGGVTGGLGELVTLGQATEGGLTLNEAAEIQRATKCSSKFIKQISSMKEYEELVAIAEKGGLAIKDMELICNTTKYPLELVKLFRTTEEGTIYFEEAGLVAESINGNSALIRSIDLTYKSEIAGETVTNLERMRRGYAAIDPITEEAYELHHIGQTIDSPLAILTKTEHTGAGNYSILHNPAIENGVHSLLSDAEWASQRSDFWKAMYQYFSGLM